MHFPRFSIYIHIPFCQQACSYCDFHFSTNQKLKQDYVSALLQEIELRAADFETFYFTSIYMGGGTPSLLDDKDLNRIFRQCYQYFKPHPQEEIEITLEANPEDMGWSRLQAWRAIGFNRLSIGVQSFDDVHLQWMNRVHNKTQALNMFPLIQASGFDNFSIDLIFGFDKLSMQQVQKNLDILLQHQSPHISCYALTAEPKTLLQHRIQHKIDPPISDQRQAEQFVFIHQYLEKHGYEHYEISSYAKEGKRSKHNSSYWNQSNYLGLGASAHSLLHLQRSWNVRNNALYIQGMGKQERIFEEELLSPTARYNEYIMTSLRTREGCDIHYVHTHFNLHFDTLQNQEKIQAYQNKEWLKVSPTHLSLTLQGMLYADHIAASLFV